MEYFSLFDWQCIQCKIEFSKYRLNAKNFEFDSVRIEVIVRVNEKSWLHGIRYNIE